LFKGKNEGNLSSILSGTSRRSVTFKGDIQNFFAAIRDKPPKTVKLMLARWPFSLLRNNVELPRKFWRRLEGRVRGSRTLTLDKVTGNFELKSRVSKMSLTT
jgi:hypothetical protein